MFRNVAERHLELKFKALVADAGHDTRTSAIAAVGGAAVSDEKEHTVRIAMDETGHRHVGILAARVGHFFGVVVRFLDTRDHLSADRAGGVVFVDQVEEVRGDCHRELASGQQNALAFLGGELEVFLHFFQRGDAVLELPLVGIPVVGRNILAPPVAGSVGFEGFIQFRGCGIRHEIGCWRREAIHGLFCYEQYDALRLAFGK